MIRKFVVIRLPEWLIEFLFELTGKDVSLYTIPDVVASVVGLCVLFFVAFKDTDEAARVGWKVLYGVGIPLAGYVMFTNTFNLAIEIGANLLLASGVSVILYRKRYISDETMKLAVGLALLIPTYPLLTVFPLKGNILPYPIGVFGVTVLFHSVLLLGSFALLNLVKNRDESGNLFLKLFGKKVKTTEISEEHGLILNRKNRFDPFFTGEDVVQYLEWSGASTVNDVTKVRATEYVSSFSEDEVDDDVIEEVGTRFELLRESDHAWVSNMPTARRILFGALFLSLLFGDYIPHVLVSSF